MTLPNIENWVMTMITKLSCKFANRITLSLFGVISKQIMMTPTLNSNNSSATHHFSYFNISLASLISACLNDTTLSFVCNPHPQLHSLISKLPSDSQWSTMLFMVRSLCCTFLLCNSNINHSKVHNDFTLFFWKLSNWSHHCHSVGSISMMLSFGQYTLSWIYNYCRVPPFHHSV